MQGTEKICAAKPVASRPLSKSSQTSSSATEKTIAIRPKTVRFRPRPSSTPEAVPLKRLQSSCIASPEKGSETNLAAELFKPSVLYRPTARVVSATKASLLANLEAFDAKRHENMNLQAPTYERNLSNRHTTSRHQNSSSYADVSQSCEPSNTAASLDMELDVKAQHHGGDKLSYDGYNWRKYGQKQVKGSEHPRSYYKCTHPRCPVKKNVERSVDGQIAEIVYKGEHNHPKPPQSLKRLATNSQAQATVSDEQGRDGNLSTVPSDWNISAAMVSNRAGSRAVNVTGDKFDRKRSTDDNEVGGANIARPDGAGSNSTTQNPTDAHISGDGFHWRKYGQKVVKGNSYPRSYYRCTDPRCNARKYVERAADEPGSLVTRYEGQHTHDVPTNKG